MIRKKIDCHLHTNMSPDGRVEPEKMILAAIDMGLEHICITDHRDLLYNRLQFQGVIDVEKYVASLLPLKEKYADKIYVSIGLECGWKKEAEPGNLKDVPVKNLEYVINSIHEVNGDDSYYPETYAGKTKEQAYGDYLNAIKQSLDAPYPFHAVGHIGYAARYAPYSDKKMRYVEFADCFDTILKKLIDKGTILELNSSVGSTGVVSLPDTDVVKRYRELGGEEITFSSDAHTTNRICDGYERIAQEVVNLGFGYFTVIQNGNKKHIKIED